MHHCQINFLNASSSYGAVDRYESNAHARAQTDSATAVRLPVRVQHLQRGHQDGVVSFHEDCKHDTDPE